MSPRGLVEFRRTAETVILVRYLERIVTIPLDYVRTDPSFAAGPQLGPTRSISTSSRSTRASSFAPRAAPLIRFSCGARIST